jgi:hypothetical protein
MGRTFMPIGLLLIMYLLTLYLAAIVVLQHCIRRQTQEPTPDTGVRFALREGQTIVGVKETVKGVDFYIGDNMTDEQEYNL